jgi:hypothetical protein
MISGRKEEPQVVLDQSLLIENRMDVGRVLDVKEQETEQLLNYDNW